MCDGDVVTHFPGTVPYFNSNECDRAPEQFTDITYISGPPSFETDSDGCLPKSDALTLLLDTETACVHFIV
jgi:hypothetical protein